MPVMHPSVNYVVGEIQDVQLANGQTVKGIVPTVSAQIEPGSGVSTEDKQDAIIASLDKLGSATSWFSITPADSALATVPDAIYIGGDGNLVLRGDDAVDATFAVVAGQILPLSPTQVRAATTATGIVGLVA